MTTMASSPCPVCGVAYDAPDDERGICPNCNPFGDWPKDAMVEETTEDWWSGGRGMIIGRKVDETEPVGLLIKRLSVEYKRTADMEDIIIWMTEKLAKAMRGRFVNERDQLDYLKNEIRGAISYALNRLNYDLYWECNYNPELFKMRDAKEEEG